MTVRETFYQKFEALKQELEEMGMFAAEYKQPIPPYAMKIGVVTAPTGAAVQDIRNISARRNPFAQLILYPALVQGGWCCREYCKWNPCVRCAWGGCHDCRQGRWFD